MKKKKVPLSIYAHIPFCIKKCGYCDFLSFCNQEALHKPYIDALCEDIKQSAAEFSAFEVKTIFFGGGTPTFLPSQEIVRAFDMLKNNYHIADDCCTTIEANPETVDLQKLTDLYSAGFNRISFGVQSFNNKLLKKLGRVHNAETAVKACGYAKQAGFANINLDLMFALPGQSLADWERTLDIALETNPQHISCYSLIIEKNTPFGKNKKMESQLPSDELDREMYYMAKEKLHAQGFSHYEISNFAKDGYQCAHNNVYWTGGDYIGFGLGAHSMAQGVRYHKTESLPDYIALDLASYEREDLTRNDLMSEFMFLGLRLTRGVSIKEFQKRFSENVFAIFGDQISELMQDGLLERDDDLIRLTSKGLDLANRVFYRFLL